MRTEILRWVIIITTKKGKSDAAHFNFKASYGIEKAIRTLDLLDATQFASLHNEMMTANGQPQNPLFEDPTSLGRGTNWTDELFQTAAIQNYSLNYSGGNDKTTYYVSAAYFNQEGIVRTTQYERYTVQFNMDTQMNNWLKMGNKLSLNHDIKKKGEYSIKNTMLALPTQAIKNDDGSWAGPVGLPMYVGDIANPIGKMMTNSTATKGFNILGNIYAEVKPWEWLTFKTIVGVQALFWDDKGWSPKYDWQPISQPESYASRKYNKSLTLLWDNTLTFNKTFAEKHQLTVMVGSSAQSNTYEYLGGSIMGFISPTAQQLDNGTLEPTVNGNGSDWALLSYLGRINYTYDNKYLLTATIRRDGSSRFGKNNRWGTFPSVSLAWRISQENWFPKDNNFLMNDLKLRVGYGVTGNQEIGNYGFVASYNTGVYPFGNNNSTALVSTTLSNPNIHWEEVRQTNFGVDMSLFNSRVNLSLDAYIKKTADMLVKASIPITSGFEDTTETFTNAGKMRNKGVEMTLRTINLKGLFSWESALTATYNKNEILDLNSETPMFINQMGNSYVTMLRTGYPINVFYGYMTDGLFQNWEEVNRHATQPGAAPGDIRFRDLNNDGVINDEDRTVIGNPNPNWFFSLSNNFSYKGWELSVFLQGVSGNKIYNANNVDNEGMAAAYNQTTAVLNRWTGEGTSNSMPRAIWGDPNQNCRVSDRFVENGSYLRLKNITLSYTLPKKWMQKIQLENARISFSCENVATITGYSGFDPEVDINGIDSSRYPISRTFSMGLNFNF